MARRTTAEVLAELPVDLFPDDQSKINLLGSYKNHGLFANHAKTFRTFARRLIALRTSNETVSFQIDFLAKKYNLAKDDMLAVLAMNCDANAASSDPDDLGETIEETIAGMGIDPVEVAPDADVDVVDLIKTKPAAANEKKKKQTVEESPFEERQLAALTPPAKPANPKSRASQAKRADEGPLPGQATFPAMTEPEPAPKPEPAARKRVKVKVGDRISHKPANRSPVLGRVTAVSAVGCTFVDDANKTWKDVALALVRKVKDDAAGLPGQAEVSKEFMIPITCKDLKHWSEVLTAQKPPKGAKKGDTLVTFRAMYDEITTIKLAIVYDEDGISTDVYAVRPGKKLVDNAKPAKRIDADHILKIDNQMVRVSILAR